MMVLALPLTIGCGEMSQGPSAVVRDSAGVRIVENSEAAWQPGEEWRLGATPALVIGGVDGNPSQELFGVNSAIRVPNGDIVISNRGTRELRFFDPNGEHRATAGGRGDGPGEFQSLGWVLPWRGDSVVAYSDQRLTFFDQRGMYGRVLTVRGAVRAWLDIVGIFTDGSMFATTLAGRSRGSPPPLGLVRGTDHLFRIAANGEAADSVGWAPGVDMFKHRYGNAVYSLRLPIPHQTWYAIHGDMYYVATNDTYEIKQYTSRGALRTVIRTDHDAPRVTRAVIDVLRDLLERQNIAARPAVRAFQLEFFDAAPMPETMPAYGGSTRAIHVDGEANLWVQEYNMPGEEQNRWTVFGADGLLLGMLDMPLRFEPYDIGADYVLGKWQDDLDVEYVQLYELIKPER